MRIMVFTDPLLSGTGFGEEARHIMFRLAQSGHEILWLNMGIQFPMDYTDYMFPDLPHKGKSITTLGNVGDKYNFGADALMHYYNIYHPDLMFVLADPQNIVPYVSLRKEIHLPLMFYTTLDGLPVNQSLRNIFSKIDITLAMTEWAFNEYRKVNFNMTSWIHHGINWNYWQTSEVEKSKIKQKYNLEDYTVFISWDNNNYRKRFDALLRCWRDFKPLSKKAKLVLNTPFECDIGWKLEDLIKRYDIPRETIISPKQLTGVNKVWGCGETVSQVKEIASLGDIYVSTTGGEGFGKTLLESMTLGLTTIVTDYSATREVVDNFGVLVPCYEGRAGRFQMHDACKFSELGLVNEEKFTEQMLYYYDHPSERKELGLRANEYSRLFDYDTQIMVGWNSLLSQVNPDVLMAQSMLK